MSPQRCARAGSISEKASGQLVNNERKIADGAEPLKSTLRAESNKNL